MSNYFIFYKDDKTKKGSDILLRGIFIADIHIGAMSYDDTKEMLNYFKATMKEYTKKELLDFIIVGGDFFDKQIYGNDPYITIAFKMMLCILHSAKVVRVINGTSSHDANQYQLFSTLTQELSSVLDMVTYDFKVIQTVSEEELFDGVKVLYLPEEYIFDQKEYYKEFFEKKGYYDYVFGHGIIQEAMTYVKRSKEKKGEALKRKPAIFNSAELSYICKGKIYFGHYHIYTNIKDKVFYSGSYARWIFGEEEEKGFFYLTCDPKKEEYKETFIINDKALRYVTMSYGYQDSVFDSLEGMKTEADFILDSKERYEINYIRVIFNIPVGYEQPDVLIDFFRNRFKDDKSIKIEFSNGYVENKKRASKDSATLSEDSKIILDKNIPEETKIAYFLKEKLQVEMSEEKIIHYLELDRKEEHTNVNT